MKVLTINGSPRKKWNTATLLNKAIEGAASLGAETELIHLYDLDFKGCRGCYSCKLIDGKSYGRCAAKDDLTPILKEVEEVDAIILGSPIILRVNHRRGAFVSGKTDVSFLESGGFFCSS